MGVTLIQLNGSDLIRSLSLYCQPHTRWSTKVFCSVATVTLNEYHSTFTGYYTHREREAIWSNEVILYDARIRNGIIFHTP